MSVHLFCLTFHHLAKLPLGANLTTKGDSSREKVQRLIGRKVSFYHLCVTNQT